MEDASTLSKIPRIRSPDIWISLPKHKRLKSWSDMEDPVVPLERNLYGHPPAGLLWEMQFEKVLLEHGWEKFLDWECLFVNRAKRTILIRDDDSDMVAGMSPAEISFSPSCVELSVKVRC